MKNTMWMKAPSWANWLAQDKDGRWYWYEERPNAGYISAWHSTKVTELVKHSGWQDTLEPRPEWAETHQLRDDAGILSKLEDHICDLRDLRDELKEIINKTREETND